MVLLKKYQNLLHKTAILFSKFASVGLICVGFNWTCNFVLLKYFHTPLNLTYIGVYLISILLSFLLNSHFTYQSKKTFKNLISYYLIYLSALLIGILLLNIYDYLLDFEQWVYPFMVTPVTMLWNFFNATRVLGKRHLNLVQ